MIHFTYSLKKKISNLGIEMNIIREYIPFQKEENIKIDLNDTKEETMLNKCTSNLVHQIELTEHNLNNIHTIDRDETLNVLNESMEEVLTNSKLIIEKTISKKELDNEDITDINNQCKYLSSLNNIYISIKDG
tara:strand:- start:5336 stop:5734 length:399 start_codon:yes stop_codon:yes gene_type:complete